MLIGERGDITKITKNCVVRSGLPPVHRDRQSSSGAAQDRCPTWCAGGIMFALCDAFSEAERLLKANETKPASAIAAVITATMVHANPG